MKRLQELTANIEYSSHGSSDRVQGPTARKIEEYSREGWRIIVGNNPHLDKARKYRGYHTVRLSRTNSKTHGFCIRTIWAVKPRAAQECRNCGEVTSRPGTWAFADRVPEEYGVLCERCVEEKHLLICSACGGVKSISECFCGVCADCRRGA